MLAGPTPHGCVFSTTIPCYDIHQTKSFMNVPPITLAQGERVSEATLAQAYRDADIFCLPSRYEGYGMVFAEAMARGLPIIASTGGAAADTLPDGAGLKIPPNDAPALREALRRALSDSALRAQLAQAASAAALSLPTWNDAANIIAQTLRAVADGDSK
jgi:glycosyltransferase involved in cell wall biosynthesis